MPAKPSRLSPRAAPQLLARGAGNFDQLIVQRSSSAARPALHGGAAECAIGAPSIREKRRRMRRALGTDFMVLAATGCPGSLF